ITPKVLNERPINKKSIRTKIINNTLCVMPHAMHNLAAYSELLISLLSFYGSAAAVLNTHFGKVVLPVGKPFGIFKK
ncbi:hypothetical protein ACT453_59590, partial [Bacillus sp. D-CC]